MIWRYEREDSALGMDSLPMPPSCSLLSPCLLNSLSSSNDLLYTMNSYFFSSIHVQDRRVTEVQNKVGVGMISVCCQMPSWKADSNHKDLVKRKGSSLKCSGDQREEWDWGRLGSLWATRMASILTKGGQLFHSHYAIAFPGFTLAGNT